MCHRLLPNDVRVTIRTIPPGNLSMNDWQTMKEVIEAVRQAIPDAHSSHPGRMCLSMCCQRLGFGCEGVELSEE